MQNTVMIFSARMARELLKKGFTIVDIKPDKKDPDMKRSIFVFRWTQGIMDILNQASEKWLFLLYTKEHRLKWKFLLIKN